MQLRFYGFLLVLVLFAAACSKTTDVVDPETPATKFAIGKAIFFDKNLSTPVGQSCASCHDPAAAFADPKHAAVSPGAINTLFSSRNAPTISYSMYVPKFQINPVEVFSYEGGLFLDGRVNTLEEQAQKPFVNPLEMNNANLTAVINKIKKASYYSSYKKVYGEITDETLAIRNITEAIAIFERSEEVNPFSSKFDLYLTGKASLTAQELNGLNLFNNPVKGKCSNCHDSNSDKASGKVLFTRFIHLNIGVPRNETNPFYLIPKNFNAVGSGYIDFGLGALFNNGLQNGKFRTPTLRNIANTAPYFHNGVFKTLEEVVHFYNKRDVPNSGIAAPEVLANVDRTTGNLNLTAQEEADIVAFMKTLSDGYK